jgi:hypothetical protein
MVNERSWRVILERKIEGTDCTQHQAPPHFVALQQNAMTDAGRWRASGINL